MYLETNLSKLDIFIESVKNLFNLLFGKARKTMQYIDCDADPFVPEGYTLLTHQKNGIIKWDPNAMELMVMDNPKDSIESFWKEVETRKPYNANLLDHLLKYPKFIPEEWKPSNSVKYVQFAGTVYLNEKGEEVIRTLFCRKAKSGFGPRLQYYSVLVPKK